MARYPSHTFKRRAGEDYFGEFAFYKIVKEPDRISRVNDQVIVAAGWKPGWSTDYVAAKCAQVLGARELLTCRMWIMYDKDPRVS